MYFSSEVDPLAAVLARDPFAFVTGKFFRRQFNPYPLRREQIIVGHLTIGQHLLLIPVLDLRMQLASQRLGRFLRGNPDCFPRAFRQGRRTNSYLLGSAPYRDDQGRSAEADDRSVGKMDPCTDLRRRI